MPAIYNISSNLPFLESLAKGILERFQNLEEITIFLPNRRSAAVLAEIMLQKSGKDTLILPKIQVIGDVDEEELYLKYFPDYEKIPPVISQTQRLYTLARLINEKGQERKDLAAMTPDFAQSVALARSLIKLIDELQNKNLGFDALQNAVPDEFAEHWQVTIEFMKIISEDWKNLLVEKNLLEPIEHRNKIIARLAKFFRNTKPTAPIIIAGTTGTINATVDLIRAVLGLENGYLVLNGFDKNLSQKDFDILEETHPQYNLGLLVRSVDGGADDVKEWEASTLTKRQKMISTALFPTARTAEWKNAECDSSGIFKLECTNLEEEALAIAFILREMLEEEKKRGMVVTNNRALAERISAKMKIWDVEINDSAGKSMAELPASTYLIELVDMVRNRQAPIQVLSFFKHPFTDLEIKNKIRAIEIAHLRGPRKENFDVANYGLKFEELQKLARLFEREQTNLLELFDAHIKAAEKIVPPEKLWERETDNEVREFLGEFRESINVKHQIDPKLYPEILAQFLASKTHRPKFGSHPRIDILSPSEARMQTADVVIIAGMNEGGMPSLPEADSFMNQQIRRKIGLDLLSRKIGQAAHDFELLSQAPKVFYTRSVKEGSTPMVKSRFLQRLEAVCDIASGEKYLHWARELHEPLSVKAAERPKPCPPIEARPKELSATRVGKLMRDPYVVYAEKVLKLQPLDEIDEEVTAAKFGEFIHKSLELFSINYDGKLETLLKIGQEQFKQHESFVGAATFWWPKFLRIADWFVKNEAQIRREGLKQLFEVKGEYIVGGIKYTAKADRVEIDGSVKVIDYKTGQPPSFNFVEAGLDPQLAIEAIMFCEQFGKPANALEYWYLKGSEDEPVQVKATTDPEKLKRIIDNARKGLADIAQKLMLAETPFIARPWSRYSLPYNDYEHLERIKEWDE